MDPDVSAFAGMPPLLSCCDRPLEIRWRPDDREIDVCPGCRTIYECVDCGALYGRQWRIVSLAEGPALFNHPTSGDSPLCVGRFELTERGKLMADGLTREN